MYALLSSRLEPREAPPRCVAPLVHLVRHRGHLDDFAVSLRPPLRPPMVGSIHRVLSCSSTSLTSLPPLAAVAVVTCKNAFTRPFTSLPYSLSLFFPSPPLHWMAPSLPSSSVYGIGRWRLERVFGENCAPSGIRRSMILLHGSEPVGVQG